MEGRIYKQSLPLSILVHALFLLVLAIWVQTPRTESPHLPMIIEIAKPQHRYRKQVIHSTAGRKSQEAADDAYLGKETLKVKEEQVARHKETGAQSEPRKGRTKEGKKQLSRFGVPLVAPAAKIEDQGDPRWAAFSDQVLDYVPGVKEGDYTAVNTKEFVYYSYYQRIRTRLNRAWEGSLREKLTKLYRSGRRLASNKDHVTKTVVVLNSHGEVVKVQIMEESGVHDLDEATVEAFNRAGPFPNPPKGLIDQTGNVRIPWDFILET